MKIRSLRRAAARLLLLAAAFGLPAAHGQGALLSALPGMPKASAPTAASATAPTADDGRLERLNKQLEEARSLGAGMAADGVAVPPGITDEEVGHATRRLAQWSLSIDRELRAIAGINEARADRSEAIAADAAWTGFAEKPPYSILRADELAQQSDTLSRRIEAAETTRSLNARELERLQQDLLRANQSLRSAEERARADTADAALQWRARATRWHQQAVDATAAAIARDGELAAARSEADKARLALVERQRQAVKARVAFTQADLQRVRQEQQARQARIEKAAAAAQALADHKSRELAAATRALQALRTAEPAPIPARLEAAEAQLQALAAATDTARRETEILTLLGGLAASTADVWQLRFDALNAPGAERRREATAALRDMIRPLGVWRRYASGQLEVIHEEQGTLALAQEQLAASSEVQRFGAARAEALSRRALVTQQLLDEIDRDERMLKRWLTEFEVDQAERSWQDRAAAVWVQAAAVGRAIWRFELFAVEDTIDIQGQKVTTTRGVTVGKSIGALLVFLIGCLIAARLARRLERTLIGRFAVDAMQARTIRRWLLWAVGLMLLVLTLNLAQIPLTVFAFLGGALAIGVGFGTQTIIKNLISGLILLMERQVRVGDSIEVDGFTGTVSEINLRSSTIKGFDGIDAILPNSALLENRVTNWTMSDQRVRRVVRVGVAYGSPLRQVADLIRGCAERHGQVLKQPEPQVQLEDFGDNALIFALFIWIDIRGNASGPLIMSDLRFMIDSALAGAGISIAYPQRDIHLDTTTPLQVEISRRPATAASTPAAPPPENGGVTV